MKNPGDMTGHRAVLFMTMAFENEGPPPGNVQKEVSSGGRHDGVWAEGCWLCAASANKQPS